MKRSVALVLTIIIFAAIAVCFLRPAYPDWYFKVDGGKVTIVARPLGGRIEARDISDLVGGVLAPIELEGDGDLVQIAIKSFDIENDYGMLRFRVSTTVEGREFINGAQVWKDGESRTLTRGYMQRIEGGVAGERVGFPGSMGFMIPYPDGIYCESVAKDRPLDAWCYLPFDDVGRYRVTLCLYEWDSKAKTTLGGDPYEVSFELEYKASDKTDISVYDAFIDNGGAERTIKLLLRLRDENLFEYYMHICGATAERKEGDEWINCDDIVRRWGNIATRWKNACYDVCIEKRIEPGEYRVTFLFSDGWTTDEIAQSVPVYFRIDE